jgi:hypothetical protein
MQRKMMLIVGLVVVVVVILVAVAGLICTGQIPSPFDVNPTVTQPIPSDEFAITPSPIA